MKRVIFTPGKKLQDGLIKVSILNKYVFILSLLILIIIIEGHVEIIFSNDETCRIQRRDTRHMDM